MHAVVYLKMLKIYSNHLTIYGITSTSWIKLCKIQNHNKSNRMVYDTTSHVWHFANRFIECTAV